MDVILVLLDTSPKMENSVKNVLMVLILPMLVLPLVMDVNVVEKYSITLFVSSVYQVITLKHQVLVKIVKEIQFQPLLELVLVLLVLMELKPMAITQLVYFVALVNTHLVVHLAKIVL